MPKIKVYLVDDHTILRTGLKFLLEREDDMELVGEAGDGKTALAKIPGLRPDVVLMDITLPDINGLEVTKRLLREQPGLKILVLTMHEEPEYLQEFLNLGVKGYVPKRAADTELITAIRTVFQSNIFVHSRMAELLKESKDKLSLREKEVLVLLARGMVNKEIAVKLDISIKTVETYRARIMEKLNLSSRAELTQYALKTGMLKV